MEQGKRTRKTSEINRLIAKVDFFIIAVIILAIVLN